MKQSHLLNRWVLGNKSFCSLTSQIIILCLDLETLNQDRKFHAQCSRSFTGAWPSLIWPYNELLQGRSYHYGVTACCPLLSLFQHQAWTWFVCHPRSSPSLLNLASLAWKGMLADWQTRSRCSLVSPHAFKNLKVIFYCFQSHLSPTWPTYLSFSLQSATACFLFPCLPEYS